MKEIKKIFLLTALLWGTIANGQDYTYYISSDTIFYPIGGRIMITHEWSTPADINQEPPNLPVTLAKLEQVELGDLITSKVDGKVIYKQTGIYTCFDTGYFEIPGLAWSVNDDSIISNPLFIEVSLLPIDTTQEIRDVTGPIEIPFTFKEALPYALGGLAIIAAIVAVILIIRYKRKNSRKNIKIQAPPKPAHIVAFEQLNALQNEKLWQQGHVGQYHLKLSFIIRNYIQNRYKVDALDLTTLELNALCNELGLNKNSTSNLIRILKIGDLAKFAKASPLPNENEEAYRIIEDFVKETYERQQIESPHD